MKAIFSRFILPALALLAVLFGSAAPPASAGQSTPTGLASYSANIPGYVRYSSPVLADIDGDGRPEILVGTEAGYLVALKYTNGSVATLWQAYLGASIGSSPAVADLDGNGDMEIALGVGWYPHNQPGRIVILEHTGQERCSRMTSDRNGGPDGVSDGIFSTPALGDIDLDGKSEVVVAGYDEELYVLNDDCSDVAVPGATYGWPRFMQDNTWGSPALADINQDGRPEIILGSYYHAQPFCPDSGCGSLWVLDYKGDALPGWPQHVLSHLDSSPAVGDIDRDGEYEIVVGTGQNADARFYKVYAFRSDGTAVPGWPQGTNGWVWSSPAIVDVDGDGYQEIFAATADVGGTSSHGKLYGWRYNGQPLNPYWPVSPTNQNGEQQGVATASSPTVVDVDGDGQLEVFIVSGWDIVGYKLDATPLNAYRLCTWYSLGSTPAWGDLDGDGQLEVTIGGGHYNDVPNGIGRVYVWETASPYTSAKAPWPMWRAGAQRTGLPPPPTLTVDPKPLVVLHSRSNGNIARAAFRIGSDDGTSLDWTASASNPRVSLTPASGKSGSGGSTVLVSIDVSNLGTGQYDLGTITVNARAPQGLVLGGPAGVPVKLRLIDRAIKYYLPGFVG